MSFSRWMRYVVIGVVLAIAIAIIFYFVRWLFWGGSSSTGSLPTAFEMRVYGDKPGKLAIVDDARRNAPKGNYVALVRLLGDKDQEVFEAAEQALLDGGSLSIRPIVDGLVGYDHLVRQRAVSVLQKLAYVAIPELVKELNSTDQVKLRAVENVLVTIGDAARPALEEARTGAKKDAVRLAASETLLLIDQEKRDEIERAEREEARLKAEAVKAKAKAQADAEAKAKAAAKAKIDAEIVASIKAQATDADPNVRINAIREIGKNKNPLLFDLVMLGFIDNSVGVQNAAKKAATDIGAPIVEDLVKALKVPTSRALAKEALVDIGEPSVGPLIEAMASDDSETVALTMWTLIYIGHPAKQPLVRAFSREKPLSSRARTAFATILEREKEANPPPKETPKVGVKMELQFHKRYPPSVY